MSETPKFMSREEFEKVIVTGHGQGIGDYTRKKAPWRNQENAQENLSSADPAGHHLICRGYVVPAYHSGKNLYQTYGRD